MLSYRKLAMRVLNRPLRLKEGITPRPAAHRAAALALTAAMLTTLTAPAFADIYFIGDGDVTVEVKADGSGVTVTDSMGTHDDTLEDVTIRGGSAKATMEAKDMTRAIVIGDISNEITYPAPTVIVSDAEASGSTEEAPAQPEEPADEAETPASETKQPEDDTPQNKTEQPVSPAENVPVTLEAKDAPAEASASAKDDDDEDEVTYESKSPVKTAAETVSSVVDNVIKIINNVKDKTLKVTLEDVNIDASKTGEAAVSVTGKGDTTIELDGDNVLKSGSGHAGLEHNKTTDSGSLTIQDDNDTAGSLDATGGFRGAGIGSGGSNDAQVKITGGKITASCGDSWGAGIGSGSSGTGYVEITGGEINATGDYMGAGIGGGMGGDGNVTISGGSITASGGQGAAGIGGGYRGDGDVTITGDAVIKNAVSNEGYGAGIGGGIGSDGNVTISGNAKIENAEGGYGAAGIGGGAFASPDNTGNGTVRISDNATIDNAQGGIYGAGIGGGVFGLSDVTIEGNATVNATGGAGGTGIGGGAGAENDDDGSGNKITIRSDETGSPTIKAVGGGIDEEEDITIGGAGIGSGCESSADTDITIEGKVTIVAVAGEGNAAIGANGVEQEFPNLDEGSSITRYDSEGNETTLPSDPHLPLPDDSGDSDGSEAPAPTAPANPVSMISGLIITDTSGSRISYTSIRGNSVLTIRADRFSASLHATLGTLRTLRAEGIETITFRTLMRSTTISLDALLAMGGDDAEVVLTHRFLSSTLTVGGKAV